MLGFKCFLVPLISVRLGDHKLCDKLIDNDDVQLWLKAIRASYKGRIGCRIFVCRVKGLGCRVYGSEFRVLELLGLRTLPELSGVLRV